MIGDLAKDTVSIDQLRQQHLDRKTKMGSLSFLLSQPDFLNSTVFIYYYTRGVPGNTKFYSSDRIMQQIKKAGGMRLITRKKAAAAIMDYDAQSKLVQTQDYSLEETDMLKFMDKVPALFDRNIFDEILQRSCFKE